MKRPEEAIQRAIVQWLRVQHPSLVFYHVPNGGARSKAEGGIFKAMGVRAGVADLAFVLPGGKAAFAEIKAPGGKATQAQAEFARQVAAAGADYTLWTSLDDAMNDVGEWLS